MLTNMIWKLMSAFIFMFLFHGNAWSECAFTGYTTGGQEGFLNDAGICIEKVHRQVYRMTVECLDRGFNAIIWDGQPQVGDFIDTLGCNAIRVRPYTKRQQNTEELITGCVVIYYPIFYTDGHETRQGPLSEKKDWDFSLVGKRNRCRQSANLRSYKISPESGSNQQEEKETSRKNDIKYVLINEERHPVSAMGKGSCKNFSSKDNIESTVKRCAKYTLENHGDYFWVYTAGESKGRCCPKKKSWVKTGLGWKKIPYGRWYKISPNPDLSSIVGKWKRGNGYIWIYDSGYVKASYDNNKNRSWSRGKGNNFNYTGPNGEKLTISLIENGNVLRFSNGQTWNRVN